MKRTTGIIAEYNPFHHGHYHHLQTAVRETKSDYVIIAMSGNFVQRGEPAVFDKWIRAEMALAAGADLVVEIPTWFVLQSAEGYARAGVALLACCGATHLSFGSESGNIADLAALAQWLEEAETQKSINQTMQSGVAYAAAIQQVADSTPYLARLAPLLRGANNVLGLEYLRACRLFAPQISVHTVKRGGDNASALRKLLAKGDATKARTFIPQCLQQIFDRALATAGPVFAQDFTQALFYSLATAEGKLIRALPACSEGLENRISRALYKHRDLEGLLGAIKTKRYPRTRIQRLLIQALLQFSNHTYSGSFPPYLRILGCSVRGKKLLPQLICLNKAPLVYSARDVRSLNLTAQNLLRLDYRAADIYNLVLSPVRAQRDMHRQPLTF